MEAPVVAALITGSLALIAAVSSIVVSVRNTDRTNETSLKLKEYEAANSLKLKEYEAAYDRLKEASEKQKKVATYTEPLARACYDLQSRIFNVFNNKKNFLQNYLTGGTEKTKAYAKDNTVYLIAQYMCWMEVARKGIQFIDLGEDEKTRDLLRLQDGLFHIWGTSKDPPPMRIFAGDQRALGESLIVASTQGLECMGYGAFQETFKPGKNVIIDSLREDVALLARDVENGRSRLTKVQHALIDVLDILDPKKIRFPEADRTKL